MRFDLILMVEGFLWAKTLTDLYVSTKFKLAWLITSFSLKHPNAIKQMSNENVENRQLGDIAFVYSQILTTDTKQICGNNQGDLRS